MEPWQQLGRQENIIFHLLRRLQFQVFSQDKMTSMLLVDHLHWQRPFAY